MNISGNDLMRLVSGVMTVWIAVAAANYYMDLGWFGHYGKIILSATTFFGVILLAVFVRLWRSPEKKD
jgi:hypothetical protein